MKQHDFEEQHGDTWQRIEQALQKPAEGNNSRVLAEHYMLLCQHLAIAKERLYDASLVERLNNLVLALYRELYRYRSETRLNFYAFFRRDFPLAIYRHRYFILLSLLVFLLPGLIIGGWTYFDDEAVYSVLDAAQVRQVERMYDPEAGKIGREREADTDIFMFGFYIKNNISVAFRCFAGGLVAGIGTLLVLFFNGMFIGSVAGHLTRLDYVDTFYPFVVGHGSFELTAIVFSGAAGLRLGYAIIDPGLYSRLESLRQAGREVVPMLYGIVLMLVIAAFIEAFWSSSTLLSNEIKYSVGAVLWALVLLYALSGRRYGSR
ncbi:MAG: stage II sporulation protein M [Gammaproteobacteria bacterium]|nr:MAG: stage II sporulation protein M [Gammaproteobacteria bacterium]UCH39083.1 MAG: stage II sporulation protein M [Gammaproteobacteria bacterium]